MRIACRLLVAAAFSGSLVPASPASIHFPLRFEVNQGQRAGSARYIATSSRFTLALLPDGNVLSWHLAGQRSAELRTSLLGANPHAKLEGTDRLAASTNYFIGMDQRRWRTAVPNFSAARYSGIYPGIDLLFHPDADQLEYDFVIAPGADPASIRMQLTGASSVEVDRTGDLVIGTASGPIRWKKPEIYQASRRGRHAIRGGFVAKGRTVHFQVASYDRNLPLIIDPVLSYATFLGGGGNDWTRGMAVDGSGNIFVVGTTSSADLPVTQSAVQAAYHGGTTSFLTGDAFVAKFSPAGTLLFLTYVGGSRDDLGLAIAVDSSGNPYITGATDSPDFPVSTGAAQSAFAGAGGNLLLSQGDAFVTKISSDGRQILYSTYLGGSQDDSGMGIAVDGSGDAFVTGTTLSQDFPVTSAAYQSSNHGSGGQPILPSYGGQAFLAGDVFVAKLNPTGTRVLAATYLGGSQDDLVSSIALDGSANVYVGGYTLSNDFPVTPGAFQTSQRGFDSRNPFFHLGDAYVSKFNSGLTTLVYSTLIGGSGDDSIASIAVDAGGDVYATGSTSSSNFPVTANAFQRTYRGPSAAGGSNDQLFGDAFVVKLNPAGTALVYGSYLGGEDNDFAYGIAVDNAGNAYVAGTTDSRAFPVTPDAVQSKFAGDGVQGFRELYGDAFLAVVNPSGASLVYATYLGGSLDDIGFGIAIDTQGNVYVGGNTVSSDFPVTAGALQSRYKGNGPIGRWKGDAFLAKYSGFAASGGSTAPVLSAITNGASNAVGPVSPGMIFVVYGTGIGAANLTKAGLAASGKLDTQAGGAQLLFNGIAAPMVYASSKQSAGIVPYEVANLSSVQVVAQYGGQTSAPLTANVAAAAPGLFSADFTGSGQGAIYNQDGTVNSPSNPADKGSVIVLYGTGEGQTNPPGVDGLVAGGTPPWPAPQLSVAGNVGGLPAEVKYVGTVPLQVAGLLQVNLQLSDNVPSGNQPVVVTVGTFRTQANLTVAIR